jgi:hypothetical protein
MTTTDIHRLKASRTAERGWGEYRDTKGRRVKEATPLEAAAKAVGFQPGSVAIARRLENPVHQDLAMHKWMDSHLRDRLVRARVDRNEAAAAAVYEDRRKWNASNPELRIWDDKGHGRYRPARAGGSRDLCPAPDPQNAQGPAGARSPRVVLG